MANIQLEEIIHPIYQLKHVFNVHLIFILKKIFLLIYLFGKRNMLQSA